MDFHRPNTLSEAQHLRRFIPGSVYRAGGTHLMARLGAGAMERPEAMIHLAGIPELHGIDVGREVVRLGAMTPLLELARHRELTALCPALASTVGQAPRGGRGHRATVGGDLCACSALSAPALMVLDAWVELADRRSKRQVGLEYFFVAPGLTNRAPGEVLIAVCFGRPRADEVSAAAGRSGSLGRVSVAGRLALREDRLAEVRLAASAAAPTPLRLEPVEALLEGARPSAALFQEAGRLASGCAALRGATRASAAYRRRILGELVAGLLKSLLRRIRP